MTLQQRIEVLSQLGNYLTGEDEFLHAVMHRTAYLNLWLTKENCIRSAKAIGTHCLTKSALKSRTEGLHFPVQQAPKNIGIVINGNTPFAGLLDLLLVFLAGHRALIKLSPDNIYLIPQLIKQLTAWEPACAAYFEVVNQLKGIDAVIITSNQKQHAFLSYFSKYPNIIRKNRNSVAVLTGQESVAQLLALGDDVLAYYGLASANVSKLFLPKGYDFTLLLEAFHEYRAIVKNSKYQNNFDYNYSLLMLNNSTYHANGCILLTPDKAIQSRIACLHYEYYDSTAQLLLQLKAAQNEIYTVVSNMPLEGIATLPMGQTQRPSLFPTPNEKDPLPFLLDL